LKERRVVDTADGSKSLFIPEWDEHYHSHHGAVQESRHVFIEAGFKHLNKETISIFEMGFGTGLNAYLSYLETINSNKKVVYHAIEAFPLKEEEWSALDYSTVLSGSEAAFKKLHQSEWNVELPINSQFTLKKIEQKLQEFVAEQKYNLIYYDAFGARVQSELWEPWVFEKMYEIMNEEAVLVTYSSKGSVRRAMLSTGFKVEKIPGPPGKREMLRAIK